MSAKQKLLSTLAALAAAVVAVFLFAPLSPHPGGPTRLEPAGEQRQLGPDDGGPGLGESRDARESVPNENSARSNTSDVPDARPSDSRVLGGSRAKPSSEYRELRRLAFKTALDEAANSALSPHHRYMLLENCSVATILDASGQYTALSDGASQKAREDEDTHSFAFNGRMYSVKRGVFPEMDALYEYANALLERDSARERGGRQDTTPLTFDPAFADLIMHRAEEAQALIRD